jgi:hypothetical protein
LRDRTVGGGQSAMAPSSARSIRSPKRWLICAAEVAAAEPIARDGKRVWKRRERPQIGEQQLALARVDHGDATRSFI